MASFPFYFIFLSFLASSSRQTLDPKCPSVPSITLHLTNMHMYTARVSTKPGAAGKHFHPLLGAQMALGLLPCPGCTSRARSPACLWAGNAGVSGDGTPGQRRELLSVQQRSLSWKTINQHSRAWRLTKPLNRVPGRGCGELPSSWDALEMANVARAKKKTSVLS